MKKVFKLLVLAFFTAIILTFTGCKKVAEIPTLTTTAISDITSVSGVTGGNVMSSGGADVTARGVCWSTASSPTVSGSKTTDGTGPGSFTSSIDGLTPNTTYHVRAYATNSAGTAYGKEISFTASQITIATLTTTEITDISTNFGASGGNITSNGGASITERGVCWSTSANPTTDNDKSSTTGSEGDLGIFIANLWGNQGTTYFVRAYAVNSAGTAYGNEISFSTLYSVTITDIVSFTSISAVVKGNIIYDQNGNHLIGSGVCWSNVHNPTTDDSKTHNEPYSGIFTSDLTGLTPGTTYYVKAYALYDNGPAIYGNEFSFTTSYGPGTGTQKADFPGGGRNMAVGFSIGTKVYIGGGTNDGDIILNDFWEWDQANNSWLQKADLPAGSSYGAVGFSIGTKGYIGAGGSNQFWEYDPSANIWTQKSSLPHAYGRNFATAFSIGTKGYIGTGTLSLENRPESREFWEWDQATDIWTQKADFGGSARSSAVGFSIGNKGYIGTGYSQDAYTRNDYKDFWEWDQETNIWTRKDDFGGSARDAAVAFSIGNKGYIGTGFSLASINGSYYKDFWEWDQTTDAWIQKTNFAGNARSSAIGVSIGNKAYIGTGNSFDPYALPDFWEYDPTLK